VTRTLGPKAQTQATRSPNGCVERPAVTRGRVFTRVIVRVDGSEPDESPVAALVEADGNAGLLVLGIRGLHRIRGVAGSALVAAAVDLPFAHEPFATTSLGGWPALAVVALALVPLAFVELWKKLTPIAAARVAARPERGALPEQRKLVQR
jgi:hypothetical protein